MSLHQVGERELLATLECLLQFLPPAPAELKIRRVRTLLLLLRTPSASPEFVSLAGVAEQVEAQDKEHQGAGDRDQVQRCQVFGEGQADDYDGHSDSNGQTWTLLQAGSLKSFVDVAEGDYGHADKGHAEATAVEPSEGPRYFFDTAVFVVMSKIMLVGVFAVVGENQL